ncbi:MAG TPA: hydantoinase B/oxoprolinase family protein [Solirubrobacterales bacterium]
MSEQLMDPAREGASPWELVDERHYGHKFDGLDFSYIPQSGWRERVGDTVDLHTEAAEDIDLVTYQVVRHGLWNINEEHGTTVRKVSGSPIAHYANDLQPALLTEDGEYVYGGPFIQVMSATADLYVRWVLENYAEDPGIEDGDVFLADDPWVAGYHQQDHFVIHPVFWEGKIFSWVVGTLHHGDSGGTMPGSFCVDAKTVFFEPLPMPPFKIVERGKVRPDLERLFVRRSRVPDMVRLDLKSQLAGVHVAKERILKLIRRYGPDVVKASMRKIVDQAEDAFVEKLQQIPDGRWATRNYTECALVGDRNAYRMSLQLQKRGDYLIFSSDGTEPAYGSHNMTYSAWKCFIMPALNCTLANDQLYAMGGMLRRVVFKPNPGALVNALHPSAVGTAVAHNTVTSQAASVVSRMLCASETLKPNLNAAGGVSCGCWEGVGGVNQWGAPFATMSLDVMAGALGAMYGQDGGSTSGGLWNPTSSIPNIEATEQTYPQLFLYRRENLGGGAGHYRGGDAIVEAWIRHDSEAISTSPTGSGVAQPTSLGVAGGLPGNSTRFRHLLGSNVHEVFERGEMPDDIEQLDGEMYLTEPKEEPREIGPDDVWELKIPSGSGFGDPLERDPAAVARDVENERCTADFAREVYGVLFDGEGAVEEQATADQREAVRARRLERCTTRPEASGRVLGADEETVQMAEYVVGVLSGDSAEYACGRCRQVLGDADVLYKEHSAILEAGLDAIGPGFGDNVDSIDDELVWREFYCPGCGVRFEAELARKGEEFVRDYELVELTDGARNGGASSSS